MLASARRQAMARSLQAERDRFLELVERVDDLWAGR
jgi:hypothetical protein